MTGDVRRMWGSEDALRKGGPSVQSGLISGLNPVCASTFFRRPWNTHSQYRWSLGCTQEERQKIDTGGMIALCWFTEVPNENCQKSMLGILRCDFSLATASLEVIVGSGADISFHKTRRHTETRAI